MADEKTKAEIEITAKIDGVSAAVNQMNQQFSDFSKKIDEQFKSMGGASTELLNKLKGLAAGFVSLGTIKAAVADTVELTKQANKLAVQLGITGAEASVLAVALDDIYSSTDDYAQAAGFLTRALRNNEERLQQLGLKTKDASGQQKNMSVLMQEAITLVNSYKQGFDRNAVSQELFGKGAMNNQAMLKLNAKAMEDAKAKADALGLTLTKQGKESVAEYRAAMNDAKDVSTAFMKVLGEAFMPVITNVANFMTENAPKALIGFKVAVNIVVSAVWGLITSVQIVIDVIQGLARTFYTTMFMMADIAMKAMSLDWEGIKTAWGAGTDQLSQTFDDTVDNVVKRATDARTALEKLWDPDKTGAGGADTGGTKSYKTKEGSRMSQWEAQLAAQRDAYDRQMLQQGSFEQYSLAMERDYWKRILDMGGLSKEEKISVSKKYYDTERQLRQNAFEAEISDAKAQLERYKQGAAEKIQIMDEVLRKTKERFGAESKEAKQAAADRAQVMREHADREIKLMDIQIERQRAAKVSEIDLEREQLETLEALGAISAEKKLEAEKALLERQFQIELAAAQSRAQLLADDVVAYEQEMNRIAEIKQKHAVDMAKMDRDIAVEGFRPWRNLFDSITNGFSNAIKGVIQGTQTLAQATRNILQTLVLSVIDMGVKMVSQWILNTLLSKTVDKLSAMSKVAANSAVAASAAFASTAAIPIVGPELAPAAAAAAYAGAMSWMGAIPAAKQGWDIPAGVNPITQLHEREMVLPEGEADVIRGLSAGGGGAPIHIHAVDAQSITRLLRRNGGAVADELRSQSRAFNTTGFHKRPR